MSEDAWALAAPYLALLPEDAGRRAHPLREVFNGLRYLVTTGAPWRWMPNDLPPLRGPLARAAPRADRSPAAADGRHSTSRRNAGRGRAALRLLPMI